MIELRGFGYDCIGRFLVLVLVGGRSVEREWLYLDIGHDDKVAD